MQLLPRYNRYWFPILVEYLRGTNDPRLKCVKNILDIQKADDLIDENEESIDKIVTGVNQLLSNTNSAPVTLPQTSVLNRPTDGMVLKCRLESNGSVQEFVHLSDK